MGSISTSERCWRFIEEFNTDYVKRVEGLEADSQSTGLGVNEVWQQVYLYLEVWNSRTGATVHLMVDELIYDPNDTDEDVIDRILVALALPRDLIVERLKKANLITETAGEAE